MSVDYRDLAIETLAADLTDRERLLTEAIIDAMAYREQAQQATRLLHDYYGQTERQRQTIGRLRDETRGLREQILRDERAAA